MSMTCTARCLKYGNKRGTVFVFHASDCPNRVKDQSQVKLGK